MKTLVHFATPTGEWAVPIERVQEVRLASGITPLPAARPGIAGLLRRGDEVLAVLSLLGEGSGNVLILDGAGERYGLLADSAIGILRVEEETITAPPAGQEDPVVSGVIRAENGRMILLLDPDELGKALQ
ncbi:MAG: chemotaxis protein CheW [Candidatus Dormibacteria bacterium]|jgi:chemotaxis signal transduction protein